MYVVIRQYCISNGPVQLLEVITVEKPNEYMVPITAKKWPTGNIETRKVASTQIVACRLDFPIRVLNSRAKKFKALYLTFEREFFSIEYDGKEAVLSVLDIDKAKTLYKELSQKLIGYNYAFDPLTAQAEDKSINQASADLRAKEKRKAEIKEWEDLGPLGRIGKEPPWEE